MLASGLTASRPKAPPVRPWEVLFDFLVHEQINARFQFFGKRIGEQNWESVNQ
jgi:hypothetical protein